MDNIEFTIGRLDQAVRDFQRETRDLRDDIRNLRKDLDEIKFFRAKVLGASLVVSTVGSLFCSVVFFWLERTWLK